jgi:hypothetical protein
VTVTGGAVATTFANPTAAVGLTAVNGAALTAMRSDAAPPIDQAIAPTWTADHIWQQTNIGLAQPATFVNAAPNAGILQGLRELFRLADNGSVLRDAYNVEIGRAVDWVNAAASTAKVVFNAIVGGTIRAFLTTEKRNVVVGEVGFAPVATATDGFLYIPIIDGPGDPSGVPTAYSKHVPITFDPVTGKIWVYDGATWKFALLT